MKRLTLVLIFILYCGNLSAQKSPIELSGDILAIGLPAAAGSAALFLEPNCDGVYQFAESYVSQLALTYSLKYIVNERRPNGGSLSFPSGHTASAFSGAAFIQRRYGWKYGIPAYALAAYTGWTRVYAHKHYYWDVIAGAVIGTGCSYLFTTPLEKKGAKLSLGIVDEAYTLNFRYDF